MKKHKMHSIKNKKIKIIGAVICLIVLLVFVAGVIIGAIGGNNYDEYLMRLGIWMTIIAGICMGILHVLYFRTPKKFREKLYGE